MQLQNLDDKYEEDESEEEESVLEVLEAGR